MATPQAILDLVKRFGDNIESYRSTEYNETRPRVEFLDPFFECLGSDVSGTEGNTDRSRGRPEPDEVLADDVWNGTFAGAERVPEFGRFPGFRKKQVVPTSSR